MASIFGHGLMGWGVSQGSKHRKSGLLMLLAILSAIIPDADMISFKFGIPYESLFGHRGITHSIFFAVLWAMGISRFFSTERIKVFILIFIATLSHCVLDAMTTGGLGVAFFAPFCNDRYFLPFRPIKVSPIEISQFFSQWGWEVIKSEMIWIGIPVFIYSVLKKTFYK